MNSEGLAVFNKTLEEIYEKFYLILGYKFIDSEVEKK